MPGTFTNSGKHDMLDGSAPAGGITHVQAFDGDPESGGSNVSGRVAVSFAAASTGTKASTGSPAAALSIGAGQTVRWLAYYNASSGGTLKAKEDVTDEAFGAAGTYNVTSVTLSI